MPGGRGVSIPHPAARARLECMRAWVIHRPRRYDPAAWRTEHPLVRTEKPDPIPGPHEIRIRVSACGVCRTDLHLAEGDLPPRRPDTVPGHEIVGTVDMVGTECQRFAAGDRVGIAWLRYTCGECRWCLRHRENLCPSARFTGWDADGGYAEFAVVDERFAYRIPDTFDDEHAAPLLCAGIIGFRALRLADCPPGGRLGIYGFGASAHLAAQVARHQGADIYVFTRSAQGKELARELGASFVGDPNTPPPQPLDAAVIFAPSGDIVPAALAALDRGGTVAIAGIHLTAIPQLDYADALFGERVLRSVTANTRADGEEFLRIAAEAKVVVATSPYSFDAADRALTDLAAGRVRGAAVLC